jgi:hypothetical protein
MQKRALAARDARMALLDLKRAVDEAAQTAHAAELEAVHLTLNSGAVGDLSVKLRSVLDRLGSVDFDASLAKIRQSLQNALSQCSTKSSSPRQAEQKLSGELV